MKSLPASVAVLRQPHSRNKLAKRGRRAFGLPNHVEKDFQSSCYGGPSLGHIFSASHGADALMIAGQDNKIPDRILRLQFNSYKICDHVGKPKLGFGCSTPRAHILEMPKQFVLKAIHIRI